MQKKKLISVIGFSGLWGMSLVLFITFLMAFLSGGRITIDINSQGEALLELIIIPVFLILGIIGFIKE